MNAYFEQHIENCVKPLVMENSRGDFPLHYHSNVEIALILEGGCEVLCNGRQYSLRSGDIAFFDSYDIHGYVRNQADSLKDFVLVIPPKYLLNFKDKYSGKSPEFPVINDVALCKNLAFIIRGFLSDETEEAVTRAVIDLILFSVSQKLIFTEGARSAETDAVRETLKYIHLHYKENITLSSLAAAAGYSPEHISRLFNKYVRCGIPAYINRLRLDYVAKNAEGAKITALIFEAGFKSIQSYYRNKKAAENTGFDF